MPTPEEDNLLSAGNAILDKPGFDNPEATFYCSACKKVWIDPDYLERMAARENAVCNFCGSALRPSERLRCEIDEEHYKELILSKARNEMPPRTLLQPEPFADAPYAICDKCRKGILDNQRDRKDEEESAGNRCGRILMRLAFLALALYMAALYVMRLFRK
jgi:hypothetical protein